MPTLMKRIVPGLLSFANRRPVVEDVFQSDGRDNCGHQFSEYKAVFTPPASLGLDRCIPRGKNARLVARAFQPVARQIACR